MFAHTKRWANIQKTDSPVSLHVQQMGCKRWVFVCLRRWAIGGAFVTIRTTYIYMERLRLLFGKSCAFVDSALRARLNRTPGLNNLYIIGRVVQKDETRRPGFSARCAHPKATCGKGGVWPRKPPQPKTSASRARSARLKDALVELIEERGLANSAQAICARAQI